MTGTQEGSTESGFMEKPGIEPAIPGLQGLAPIHYTTGAYQGLWVELLALYKILKETMKLIVSRAAYMPTGSNQSSNRDFPLSRS